MLNSKRTLADLEELKALTSDENGAQRVAFTPMWRKARAWLRGKLEDLPLEIRRDPAGNVWATLHGASERTLLIGGHIDSVPNGGWLDGCLNLLAGVEILRRINAQYAGKPPVSVRLVDWADEKEPLRPESLRILGAPDSSTSTRRDGSRTKTESRCSPLTENG